MRHRIKKSRKINVGAQKASLVMRNMLTSLLEHSQIVTTKSKARALKVQANKFLGNLVSLFDKYEDKNDVRREAIRIIKSTIMSENVGKIALNDLLPKYYENGTKTGFIQDYKLGVRPGDGSEKILIKLV